MISVSIDRYKELTEAEQTLKELAASIVHNGYPHAHDVPHSSARVVPAGVHDLAKRIVQEKIK